MKNKNSTTNRYYVKSYLHLTALFDAQEMLFISHMVHIHYLESMGYDTKWTQRTLMEEIAMTRRIFDRCAKRFIEIKLLECVPLGKGCCYRWNIPLYEKLVEIVNSTNNIGALKVFCQRTFVTQKRSIESVTQEEIDILAKTHIHFRRGDQ